MHLSLSGYLLDHQPSHFPSLFVGGILLSIVLYSLCHLLHFVDQRSFVNGDDQHEDQQMRETLAGERHP